MSKCTNFTCTAEPRHCVVDRDNTNTMNMGTCDWNKINGKYSGPNFKPPYYEVDPRGRPVHPYITNFNVGLHDRNIEGFNVSNPLTILLIVVLITIGVYFYNNKKY